MRFFECYRLKVELDCALPPEVYMPTVMTVELEDSDDMNADELQIQLRKAIYEGLKNIVHDMKIIDIDFEYIEVVHHICGPRCTDETHRNRN